MKDHGDNDEEYDESTTEEEEEEEQTVGMANAMAQILGAPTKKTGTQSVVLSKTKTPLQKIAETEKQQEKDLAGRRRGR